MVENLIRWIPPINGIFKLNFDGSKIKNKVFQDGLLETLMVLLK